MATETTDTPGPAPPAVEDAPTGKNLVVCIDGTSNQFGRSNTNVVKLFDAIDLKTTKKKQLAYYSSGIGTSTKSQALIDRMKEAVSDTFDMAVAWSVDKNIKDAYGWLAEKYEQGDRIFLFGFSRGAYQVRALAGMIHEVGLIRTRTERQVAMAYERYEAIRPGKPEARHFTRKFKKTFCWDDLTVHFIGVWDTVSSVGLSRGDVSLPMSSPARYIRHALALDERRVKFIPEYFRETSFNSAEDALDIQRVDTSGGNQSGDRVKEVWFPGSHSDVGGKDKPGQIHQAGNIPLLWMYREAAERGLVLGSTDVTWGPDDIDFGTCNSMSTFWRIAEYIAIKQQVSHGGPGRDALRMHQSEPRLIMPHQKVHSSILYANGYKPVATRGRGFDISMMYETLEDTELDEHFWETDLFGSMDAEELVNSLGRQRLFATECIDRLLFMLRFNEGRRRVTSVTDWQEKFEKIIDDNDSAPHIKLIAIVAYYEASYNTRVQSPNPSPLPRIPSSALDNARECLIGILRDHKHRYNFRAVALLNALTRHEHLRERILTPNVLETFVKLVDFTIATTVKGKVPKFGRQENNFVQVMKGLNSLLQFKTTRKSIIPKLAERYPKSDVSRLGRLLTVNHPPFLIAALRMVLTLARIPKANTVFYFVEPRIRELAKKRGGTIGPLAVEIWFALHGPNEPRHLSLPDARFPENLASTLVRTNFNIHSLVDKQGSGTVPGLTSILGLNAEKLEEEQEKLIEKLTKVAQKGNPGVRTTMTMTLLKLCETPVIRTYLCKIGLVDIFVDQLQHKDSALLAAYALATCLKYKYDDVKKVIDENKHLPKYIVGMLHLDYFDDAIGQVEGLTIFVQLMQYSDLRKRVMEDNMMEVLGRKAGKDQLGNILSVLLYQDRNSGTHKGDDTCTQELVKESLKLLKGDWKTQKTGVTILTALAQTSDGAKIIEPRIPEIIRMILPEKYISYYPIQPSAPSSSPMLTSLSSDGSTPRPKGPRPRPASKVMGPACALRNLALNKSLQQSIRGGSEYRVLRDVYLSQTLISEKETWPWRVNTPTKTDVTTMLEKMIKAVEGELSEEDLMWIGDTLPPGVRHWDRALMFLGYTAAGTALFPVALGASICFSALTVVALVVGTPIYKFVEAFNAARRSHNRKTQQGVDATTDTHAFDNDLVWEED